MLCVTRKSTNKGDLLRNYRTIHSTQANYNCAIWEAASATAAAPIYFRRVKFEQQKEEWSDGGIHHNNPIDQALAEIGRERDWKDKPIECVLSLGTGMPRIDDVGTNLAAFLRTAVKTMTNSEETAKRFASSKDGREMSQSKRYFRFNVPFGMPEIQLEDYRRTEKMSALTDEYLQNVSTGDTVEVCAKSLLYPDENCR